MVYINVDMITIQKEYVDFHLYMSGKHAEYLLNVLVNGRNIYCLISNGRKVSIFQVIIGLFVNLDIIYNTNLDDQVGQRLHCLIQ